MEIKARFKEYLKMTEQKVTAKAVLQTLAICGILVSSIAAPNIVIAYGALAKQWKKYKRGDLGRVVKRFYKQELVKISETKQGETILELSDKGKKKLLAYDFDNMTLPKRRDGKFRVVSFDIPNNKKLARDIFRRKLKELGFKEIQKSSFISAYPCKEQILFIVNLLGIEKFVMLFELGKIELGPQFEFQSITYT